MLTLLLGVVSPILRMILLATIPVGPGVVWMVGYGVFSMSFNVLLEILWPLKSLATEVAAVRLQRYVDADV